MKVFLGGTINSNWRQKVKENLDQQNIDYFDPTVDEWDEKAQKLEIRMRNECDWNLYVITPKMKGFFSIAEVVDDSNKVPEKTIFSILWEDGEHINIKFNDEQIKSIESVVKLVQENGCIVLDFDYIVPFLIERKRNR